MDRVELRKTLVVILAVATLLGCGAVFRNATVSPGITQGTQVRVIPLSAETVVQANRSQFNPQTLPAIFSITANAGELVSRAPVLPEPPLDRPQAQGRLSLRPPPVIDMAPYTIGVGDVILLSVPQSASTIDQLSGLLAAQNTRQGYTVQDDGSINVPNVGRVPIGGKTLEEAEALIFEQLVRNQIDPTFSLEIAEFRSRQVTIGGAVASPIVLPITLRPLFLDAALAAAGGIATPDQDATSIRIFRGGELYQIPVNQLYATPALLKTPLVDGDAVFVDTELSLDRALAYFDQQLTLSAATQTARQSALAERQAAFDLQRADLTERRDNYATRMELGEDPRDYVFLVGELNIQTRFPLPFDRRATLADALFSDARGVLVETGDISQIYILRASGDPRENGAVTAWRLDARNAALFALAPQFELRPDDVIFIAQQPITTWNRAISQILPSLFSVTQAVE